MSQQGLGSRSFQVHASNILHAATWRTEAPHPFVGTKMGNSFANTWPLEKWARYFIPADGNMQDIARMNSKAAPPKSLLLHEAHNQSAPDTKLHLCIKAHIIPKAKP